MKFKGFKAFVRKGQEVLLTVLLWNAYLLGVGLTALWIRLFNRKFMAGPVESDGSFWREAQGYGRKDHDVMRQS